MKQKLDKYIDNWMALFAWVVLNSNDKNKDVTISNVLKRFNIKEYKPKRFKHNICKFCGEEIKDSSRTTCNDNCLSKYMKNITQKNTRGEEMITQFTIPYELTDLNKYINEERTNKYISAKTKKTNTNICALFCKNVPEITGQVKVIFSWYCTNKKKDPDNIAFAKKFILDGMVLSGILKNDGWNNIYEFEDKFYVDKKNPRVEVTITE